MSICPSCGEKVSIGVQQCPHCGHELKWGRKSDKSGETIAVQNTQGTGSSAPQFSLSEDPGARFRSISLMIIIGMFIVGIVFVIMGYSNTEYNGWYGTRVLTPTGRSLRGVGNILTTLAASFLFPALTFAAWKTSRWRCHLARKMMDESSGPVHFSMPLIGSVNGWKGFWMAIALIAGAILSVALLANVSEPVEIRFGKTTIDSCSLWATDVVGIIYCVLWFVLLDVQAEEVEKVKHALKVRSRGSVEGWKRKQINDMISSLVAIPGQEFFLGRFEVTQAQWEAVMGNNPSASEGDELPVENVSWSDCQCFLQRINGFEETKDANLKFRLPTEKEWEFACRANGIGDYSKMQDGTEITENTLGQVAWFMPNSDFDTHPVGQKLPNAFGLYDMHGNVWEWTSTSVEMFRISRGGSWNSLAIDCKSSTQSKELEDCRRASLGFRLCADRKAD